MGPQVSRSNVNTAPLAPLQSPVTDFLMGILSGQPTQTSRKPTFGDRFMGFRGDAITTQTGMAVPGANILERLQLLTGLQGVQPSALQQQTGNTFSQLLQGPTAQERAFNIALPQIQQQLSGVPGMDVLGAATPLFQRNLAEAQAFQRQFGGPRFAAESGRQARQLSERSLQDFNLFSQQVLEAGRQRQLQAAGVLGALGGGADASRLGLTQGAGQFALGEQGLNLQNQAQQQALLQFLLGSILTAGGANASPVITQSPSPFSQLVGLGAGGLSLAGGLGWNPFGGAGAGLLGASKAGG